MTRIILKCFLVLAFTGVLLSTAQEDTASDASHSTPQPTETSPSAPESSSVSVEQRSPPVDKAGDGSSSLPPTPTETVSTSDPASTVVDGAPSSESTPGSVSEKGDESTTTSVEMTEVGKDGDRETSPIPSSDSPPEGLHKAELQDAESHAAEVPSNESDKSNASDSSVESDKSNASDSSVESDKSNASDSSVEETSEKKELEVSDSTTLSDAGDNGTTVTGVSDATSETSETSVDGGGTTPAADALQPTTGASFSENATALNDSGQSTVPSKEETIHSSSYVDENQFPKEVSSTAPSKVQTEENDTSSKSATRKRSLNATNTATGSTPEHQVSSSTPAGDETTPTLQTTPGGNSAETLQTVKQPVFADTSSSGHNLVKDKSSTYDAVETETTNFPPTNDSSVQNADANFADFHELDHVAELVSLGEDIHLPLISSAALSTSSEKSIHPFESIDTTAQATSGGRGIATASSNPQRSPELEIEPAAPTGHSPPLVTFDPNGLTHNFSQDPDSIVFSPSTFRVDGISTESHSSRLEHGDELSSSHEPGMDHVRFTEGTTDRSAAVLVSSSHETTGSSPSERERESVSASSSHAALPHDEPDIEEIMYSSHADPSTEYPTTGSLYVNGTLETTSAKVVLPANDESEEMLNDSPHFVQTQSKPAVTPTAETKREHVIKDAELNFSNDIAHSSSPETVHELDLSTEYHTEQSEIRPVTAVSPLKTPESTALPPAPTAVPSRPPESGRPDTVLPDTSSPINLSEPAPVFVAANQSVETITETLTVQPELSAPGNASDDSDGEKVVNSTIAGISVKTSVSVSIPLSNSLNDTVNSTVIQEGNDANVSSNGSGVILPLPIPISKDADGHPAPTFTPTAGPPTPSTTESRGVRIRKPKLRITGDDSDVTPTPRTRKPFVPPLLQRPSTTVGPPVSIFKKARTRIASITSSTTARPLPKFSIVEIPYSGKLPPGFTPGGELVFSTEPITTTEPPTTTETEEPFSDEPFTEQTQGPIIPSEDDVTLIRVAGYIVVDKGLRWNSQLDNRHSLQYKEKANFVQVQLYRLFRTSPIATRLWKIKIDGFSVKKPRSVAIDFFLFLIRTPNEITMEQLTTVFHDKLKNNTFSRFTVDTNKTSFELLNYESMKPTTEPPEEEPEPVIPQWAIAVIVVGAASLIFIVLFAAVAILGRHHVRRRYSSKLNDEDSDRPSDWESKMAAAYENLAADTIYDAEDLQSDTTYKKQRYHSSTYHGRPSRPRRADSWSSSDWSPPPRRPRPQVHRIVY